MDTTERVSVEMVRLKVVPRRGDAVGAQNGRLKIKGFTYRLRTVG